MDHERRLELIAMLAQDRSWDAVIMIGKELLKFHYSEKVFTGQSGDSGPQYIVALREALARINKQKD